MQNGSHRTQVLLIYAALALISLATYWQVAGFGLTHYDDDEYVGQNPIVQQGLTLRGLKWALTTTQFSYLHPLTCLSHMLDCQLFGMNLGAHHVTSLLLHVANSLLVLAVLRRLTGATWRSAFVAALFALHPLHVESVVWIAERKDVLSTLFWLLAMLAYVRYVERPSRGRYLATLAAFAGGLMSKPMVVTLPCMLLLLDFWPLRRLRVFGLAGGAEAPPLRRVLLEKLPFFALAGMAAVISVVAMRSVGHIGTAGNLPWALRFANVPISYVRYLAKTLWPDPLAVLYPMPPHWPFWQVTVSTLILIGLTAVVLAQARRRPYLLFGWAWFLGTLVPAIGLIPVAWHSMADRYMYIPSIGLFVGLTWGLADALPSWARRKAVAAVAATLVLAACAVKTWQQTRHWENTKTLFANAVAATKDNAIAHYNLGCALLKEGDTASALEQFQTAVRINPRYDAALNNLGRLLHLQGHPADAVGHLREAVRINPNLDTAHFNLGLALIALERDEEALPHLAAAVRLSPRYAELHAELGGALVRLGRPRDAAHCYRRALRHCPNSPVLLNNLAWLLATAPDAALRNGVEAVQLAERACQLADYRVTALIGTLAAAYAEAGRFTEAVVTAEQAVALARREGQTELAEKNERLLELYRTQRPYRDTGDEKAASANAQTKP